MEIGRRGEIRGSVLPGSKVTMRFCLRLGLVLGSSSVMVVGPFLVSIKLTFFLFKKLSAAD